ncbi:helix-turn-helix domain-containing protein [Kistimonas asteriae]|uniref:helix-turn-helix domain-containing protein n=1 Tax=Kistimonas asteriae TaxID=517724 RepID=UPI001BAC09F7|nr:helix-turn-helix domain-containing protein [Kistimonas asteriae]
MEISQDAEKKYAIINAIFCKKPSLDDLHGLTGIPKITLKRQIALLRNDYKMDIQFVRNTGVRGKTGYYLIVDWGIINKARFLANFSGVVFNRN